MNMWDESEETLTLHGPYPMVRVEYDTTVPWWSKDVEFKRIVAVVEAVEPDIEVQPSWTSNFNPLVNDPLGVGYSGGGETVPGGHQRFDWVKYTNVVALQTWF